MVPANGRRAECLVRPEDFTSVLIFPEKNPTETDTGVVYIGIDPLTIWFQRKCCDYNQYMWLIMSTVTLYDNAAVTYPLRAPYGE